MESKLIQPLGAGDLIDRAIRLYRQNFWTFIQIASPPVIIGSIFSFLWTLLARNIFTGKTEDEIIGYYLFSWFGGSIIWFIEFILTFVVVGGASRNLVRNLLWNEKFSFRETYKNVKSRFWALFWGASVVSLLLYFTLSAVVSLLYFGIIIAVIISVFIATISPFLAFLVGFVLILATIIGAGYVFFLIASFFIYVPSIMMVEGIGIGSAFGRNSGITKGRSKHLAALFLFTVLAVFSALSILYIPLGWYLFFNGIEFYSFDVDATPFWLTIVTQLISQTSWILITPVFILGLCLLYVDERVRHEGYDIELMAARQLGEIPAVPQQYSNPLQPALATETKAKNNSTLGLS
jgi:hypothetical protein